MAIMWPKILPPDVLRNILRRTECQVYWRLESVLEDPFVVFYSRPWLGLRPNGQEIDGECDFVVVHPELGFLSLEVKGGGVAYDPRTEQWTSRDRWGVTHNIKNPIYQARTSKHELLQKLKVSTYWKSRYINAKHGVLLPHSQAPSEDLGADMPLRIFCFLEDYEQDLRGWILRRFGQESTKQSPEKKIGKDGIFALEKILAKPFQLRIPLNRILSEDDAGLQLLTQQQFHIIRAIEEVPRVAVFGGAGTGKTVLAMEDARKHAKAGMRTLFTCYNRALAEDVRLRFNKSPSFNVMNFHELCASAAKEAGITVPRRASATYLFNELYPELLMQATETLNCTQYDAIIVDEGQDFLPLWWSAVDACLDPDGKQHLRIFYDNNQRVYGTTAKLPTDVALIPIRLTLNLRNTRRIHDLVQRHYEGHTIEAVGPEGVDIKWVNAENQGLIYSRIANNITDLVSNEGVPAENIAVLVPTEKEIDLLAPKGRVGGVLASRCDEFREKSVIVDSIRRFKGLESSVVIVAATENIFLNKELPYVSMSRARAHLILVGPQKNLRSMRDSS